MFPFSSQRLSSIPDDSTIAHTSSSDDILYDNGHVLLNNEQQQYTNPVYNWVNDASPQQQQQQQTQQQQTQQQPVVTIRSDNHPNSPAAPKHTMSDSPRVEFNKLPFRFYTGRCGTGTWWNALLQGTLLTLFDAGPFKIGHFDASPLAEKKNLVYWKAEGTKSLLCKVRFLPSHKSSMYNQPTDRQTNRQPKVEGLSQ